MAVTEPWPVEVNKKEIEANLDTVLDYRALTLRNQKVQAIFKVQAGILKAFRESMEKQGFSEFVSPILMGAPSESGADVFEVKYFENKAYLAQSPQVYKQIMLGVFERAFTVSKVFRAEKHNTSRHLMEITQLDGEMGFISDYDEVLQVVEQTVKDIFEFLHANYSRELKLWGVKLPKLPEGRFPKVKVKEALKIIEKRLDKNAKRDELDVDPEDEREIAKWAFEKYGSEVLWLLNFKKDKNFYTWNNPDDKDESLSYDLVCRGLEWLSGTHRIHKYDVLLERFLKQGLKPQHYEHYLQAFKYGIPSEAGFSFGLERMTQQIFKLENIREATLFPSDLKRIAGAKIHAEVVKGEDLIVNKIREILSNRHIEFNFFEHEATVTSDDAARVRGTKPEEGVKALILKNKKNDENIMVCVPGNARIDIKKLEKLTVGKYSFETPEEIKEKFGLEVGGVPPFGNILGLRTYFDKSVLEEEYSSFNCGSKYKSIRMLSKDLVEVVGPEIVEIKA